MDSETEVPRPLTTAEIQEGIVFKISEAVREKLATSCKLFGRSYPKFEAEVSIKIRLDNFDQFGDQDNHSVTVSEGEPGPDAAILSVDLKIEEAPPNAFRKSTNQPITVVTQKPDGKVTENKVRYAPRKAAK